MISFRVQLSLFLVLLALSPAAAEPLRVGTAPNLWFIYPVIVHSQGWDKEAGIPLEIVRFSGPATQMQGFAAGQIDVVNNNAGSILLTNEKGIPIRYIGALLHGDVTLVGNTEMMSARANRTALEAMREFRRLHDRPLRLAANPKGSMSDLSLRVWLQRNIPQWESSDLVEVINTGDQAQLQQLFITGSADGAALFEPLVSLALDRITGAGVFLTAEELFLEQNGGFTAVSTELLTTRRSDIVKLLRLYARAEKLIKEQPEVVAKILDEELLLGLVPREIVLVSIKKISARFCLDPKPMIGEVQLLAAWLHKSGQLKREPKVSELFDLSLYEESTR